MGLIVKDLFKNFKKLLNKIMQSYQNLEEQGVSKRGKHIRSIRIVDKQNTAPQNLHHMHNHARQSTNPSNPQTHTQRQTGKKGQSSTNNSLQKSQKRSISPHEFSFKKPTVPFAMQQQSSMLSQKLSGQQKQMQKLQRMLKSMKSKVGVQQKEYNETKIQYQEYIQEKGHNQRLRQEIGELKELMKELLIQKQEQRMMGFYLD